MVRVLQALCDANTQIDLVALLLPWNTISGDDYQSFVETLLRIQSKSKHMTLDFCGDTPPLLSPGGRGTLLQNPRSRITWKLAA